jgi:hypothetical protein
MLVLKQLPLLKYDLAPLQYSEHVTGTAVSVRLAESSAGHVFPSQYHPSALYPQAGMYRGVHPTHM